MNEAILCTMISEVNPAYCVCTACVMYYKTNPAYRVCTACVMYYKTSIIIVHIHL